MKGVKSAEAVIDNGEFGVRRIRFETGRLARQASGSALVVLDEDTVVLSATVASKHPKENLDFFPLTVDVEEKMYAAGRIPGSFFRREGRPSEDAILTCRLIDRPLRPSFVKGLRNEIQIVETILALNPEALYDVVAINAASMSTQLAGPAVRRPDRRGPGRADQGPVGRVPDPPAARAGHVRHGGGGPDAGGRRRRDHDGRGGVHPADAQAAGRRGGHRRHRAGRGDRGRGPRGGQAVHRGAVPGAEDPRRRRGRGRARPGHHVGVPDLRRLRRRRLRGGFRRGLRRARQGADDRTQAGAGRPRRTGSRPSRRSGWRRSSRAARRRSAPLSGR